MSIKVEGDNERLKDIILWARKHKVSIGQLTVGDISLVMTDLALGQERQPANTKPEATARDLYREYGGQAIEALEKQAAELETVIEDDD